MDNENDEYRIEVDTGSGGYGFTDTLAELLADVKFVYGKKEVEKCLYGLNPRKRAMNM